MRRGTTPTHNFKVDVDLDNIEAIYITYQQEGDTIVEKSIEDITIDTEKHVISTTLTQADTLGFNVNNGCCFANSKKNDKVQIQIRIKYIDGSAIASDVITTGVDEILKDGEI